ncbi:probable LRR receptor-like serine/threonine-protein kinase At1g34110 [Cucurbita maxima]|uniref:Probable LRR receptor-like serine/threonine-protein kinase At1g34110 n=1 Tax=Cucurbita maxima TaxID=3661 RepID=A0A6J1L3T6_CUCMA|nr:probable LRR receptor-like serine/threonine-protein kinase At1g34110 [Cucurbita maxima]
MGFVNSPVFMFCLIAFSSSQLVHGNSELKALMELKESLDPEKRVLRSWTIDGDPCGGSFDGVACNENRKVANISLQGRGLSGKVSPAVAKLKCLTGLFLHYNNLSGEIPREISSLNELADLYLDVNSLTGDIPEEIGNMSSLQVLQICCNELSGNIPNQLGSLKKLTVLALQHNRLSGEIPMSLGSLQMLKRIYLSFNNFNGAIPIKIAAIPQLEVLDIRNNSLSGHVPSGLKRLNEGFQGENNPNLCGIGFVSVRNCTVFDTENIKGAGFQPFLSEPNKNKPESADFHNASCYQLHCSKPTTVPRIAIVSAVLIVSMTLLVSVVLTVFWYRRRKQVGSSSVSCDNRLGSDQARECYSKSASPLVCLEYSHGWDSLADGIKGLGLSKFFSMFIFNIEEVESATQYFSEANLLGRSSFSMVYKGVLKDGSSVAIRSIHMTSCKSDEAEFLRGLNLLSSLRHENLVSLRGFCCSRGRGEFFLVYDFVSRGSLSQYLDVGDGSSHVLDWSKRVSIINGIAKGIAYLHREEANKPAMVHKNISIEKILIDHQFNALISDSGLSRLLADDIIFSSLKTSAAMGYLAPEYITIGRFSEKSDIYAFGVVILQILSGTRKLTNSLLLEVEVCKFDDLINKSLKGNFSESQARKLARLAVSCTNENPINRPAIEDLIEELTKL